MLGALKSTGSRKSVSVTAGTISVVAVILRVSVFASLIFCDENCCRKVAFDPDWDARPNAPFLLALCLQKISFIMNGKLTILLIHCSPVFNITVLGCLPQSRQSRLTLNVMVSQILRKLELRTPLLFLILFLAGKASLQPDAASTIT